MLISYNLHALLEVSLDGTKPYTEIQTAISSAVANDTILVYPGTYFENLILNNTNNISLLSLETITNDTSYISQTIINGSHNQGSVILLNGSVYNATVRGFTITGGSGFEGNYNTYGGGIFVYVGELNLINSIVEYNASENGGGINLDHGGSLSLSGSIIRNNVSYRGGGGLLIGSSSTDQPEIVFDQVNRCSIYDNYAQQGADIHWIFYWAGSCEVYLDKFTVAEPDRYYIDYWDINNYFYEDLGYTPFVVVDIWQGVNQEIDADLYVSNDGDDNNSGLSPDQSLRTVHYAYNIIKSNSENPRTIYMAAGVYDNSILNWSNVPIALKSNVTLTGVSPEATKIIIDKSVSNWPVGVVNSISLWFENITVKNMTLSNLSGIALAGSLTKNFKVENVIIENCNSEYMSPITTVGSLYFSSYYLKDVIIRNNTTETRFPVGGRFMAKDVTFDNVRVENNQNIGNHPDGDIGIFEIMVENELIIKNSKFINNYNSQVQEYGADFRFWHAPGYQDSTKVVIDNCLFANNINTSPTRNNRIIGKELYINNCTFANNSGGSDYALTVATDHTVEIYNTIIANNEQVYPILYGESLIVDNCLFSNTSNIASSPISTDVTLGEGNIYGADPLFAGTDPANPTYYMLTGDDVNGYSPAIDTGSRDFSFMPDWYESPREDLYGNPRIYGNRVDMGCYEFQGVTVDNDVQTVSGLLTAINYPNPFNPETTIEFNNPVQGLVNINIYNLKGQLVKNLLEDNLKQGVHKVVWQGRDSNDKQVASGVYFYKISSENNQSVTKKIILMK
jgi:hypothetical protein